MSTPDTLRDMKVAMIQEGAQHPADLPPLADGFEEYWAKHRVKRVLNPAGVARMVWEASARHQRAALAQAQPSLTDERAAFEASILDISGALAPVMNSTERRADGLYLQTAVEAAWRGYRAALAQAQPSLTDERIDELRSRYTDKNESREDIRRLVRAALATQAAQPEHVPHTAGGFHGAMIGLHGRKPTEQEVWDAAIRSYRDLNPVQPVQAQGVPSEVLPGWKFNHAQEVDSDGIWALGWRDPEDGVFAPFVEVDTGEYYQPKDAEPLALAILARLIAAPAPQQAEPQQEPDKLDAERFRFALGPTPKYAICYWDAESFEWLPIVPGDVAEIDEARKAQP